MEKRSESRIESHVQFFVQIHECAAAPELVGSSISCSGVDFSAHGLQLKTDHKIPVNTYVNITIGIGEPFSMYSLFGDVRWARGDDQDCFMGILLKDEPGSDFGEWVERFNSIFES
jgi:hypothetical protein